MTISRLELTNFTVFKKASFEFCPGINVLIGENGTGKSHVLKAMYAAQKTARNGDEELFRASQRLLAKLLEVFRPEGRDFHRLIRRGAKNSSGFRINDEVGNEAFFAMRRRPTDRSIGNFLSSRDAIFMPAREVLAMYRGFVAAYEGRELDFDETYYDLCKALSAAPLRGTRARAVEVMLGPLELILGGKVALEGDRFFVEREDGGTEAHLVAEGLRKIASLAYLVANGSLTADSVLFWDEPEASLNPSLVVKVVEFLRALAASGVQVFLASHDFLLVHRLSQAVEYGVEAAVPVRFFSLFRPGPGQPVEVEQGETLADIEHNAILDEFARYYDREQVLSAQAMRGEEMASAAAKVSAKPRAAIKKQEKTGKLGAAKKSAKAPARQVAAKAPAKKAAKKKSAKKVARG